MKSLILIVVSFAIGLYCVKYLRTFDKHEKEPFLKMFSVTCWGGAWSIAISFVLYFLVHLFGVGELRNSFGALFVIGPVEEFAKLVALFSSYFIIKNDLNEPADGLIYMACVALGFSLIENYTYAMHSGENVGQLLVLRLFTATPMHISSSAFMGLSYYLWLKNRSAAGLLLISFLYASFIHGIYDLTIFNGFLFIAVLVVLRFAYDWTLSLLSYATAVSPYRKSLREFIGTFENPQIQGGLECLHCGSVNPKLTYSFEDIFFQKCDECEKHVTTKEGIFHIFHHFAPTFKKLDKHYISRDDNEHYSTLYGANTVSDGKKIAFFQMDKLNDFLEKLNDSIIKKMEEKWWFPENMIGFADEKEPVDYQSIIINGGVFLWRMLIYPFSMDKSKRIHIPQEKGPVWNWGAFLIPELWFLYHEIWGVFFLATGIYLLMIYAVMYGYLDFFGINWLIIMLLLRIIAGRSGSAIFYFRHGKWPEN